MDPTPVAPAPQTLLRIEYTPTRAEFVEAALYPFRGRRLRGTLLTLVSAALLTLIGAINWGRGPNWSLWLAVALVIVALVNPFLTRRLLGEHFRKHPQMSETSVATYSAEGIFVQTPSADTLVRWHAFTHVTESRRLFFLNRGPGNSLFLAKRVFATPAEVDAYRALLMQYIGRTAIETRPGFPMAFEELQGRPM